MVDKQVGVVEAMSEDVNILGQVLSMLHNKEECWGVQGVWQHARGLKTLCVCVCESHSCSNKCQGYI